MNKRQNSRDKLLDASEKLFAERGYPSVSLKTISEESGVNVGLINYYFGTKDRLLHETIKRRSVNLFKTIRDGHDRFAASLDGAPPDFRKLLRAHYLPFVEFAVSPDQGERNFIRLLVSTSFWETWPLRDIAEELWALTSRLIGLTQRCFPDAAENDLRMALYLGGGSLSYLVLDRGFLSALTEGSYSIANLEKTYERFETFILGGAEMLSKTPVVGAPRSKRKAALKPPSNED